MQVLIKRRGIMKSTVRVKDSYRHLKNGTIVHVSAHSRAQNKIRQSAMADGLKTHRRWAKECMTVAEAKKRQAMARHNVKNTKSFIWFKEHISPGEVGKMTQWHGYEANAPAGVKKEYKAFWQTVVGIYQDRIDTLKLVEDAEKGIDPNLLKSCTYRMEKDADSGDDEFHLTHPRTLKRYQVKAGKHYFKDGKWVSAESKPENAEEQRKENLKKSWSSSIMKKHPGSRWVTVTDASSPMHGRHILIVPHADGTATIAWAPEKTGLAHKVLHPKEKEKDAEEERRKKIEQQKKQKERREAMSDEKVAEFETKKQEAETKVKEGKKKLHSFIRERAGLETELTEEEKKKIDKEVKKLAEPEQRKARMEAIQKARDEKKEILKKITDEAKKILLDPDGEVDTSGLDGDKLSIRELVKEHGTELLQIHYEIEADRKELREANKVLKTGKITRPKSDEVGVRDLSKAGIKEMVEKEAAIKSEIEAHYNLIVATRGGIDRDGQEIKAKSGESGVIQKEMAKGTMEALTGITGEMSGEAIMHEDVLREIGSQNAAVIADHYMREKLGEQYESATDRLREYIDKKGTQIAADAVAKGDKALQSAQKIRKHGTGPDSLYASVQQALGQSLAYTNRAYAAYGQAEGALNMAAEMLYQVDNKKKMVEFNAANTTALKNKASKLGLKASEFRIKKNGVGDYTMTIKPESYAKLMDVKTIAPNREFTGEPTPQSIKAGKFNDPDWLPAGIKPYITSGDGETMTRMRPMAHQQIAARLFTNQGRVFLNHEAGTGKSLTYLMSKAALDEEKGKSHKMIISMPSKLMANFEAEVKKFSDYNVVLVDSASEAKRAKMYQQDPNTIVVVNKEKFYFDRKHIEGAGFDVVVNDEAHKLTQRGEGNTSGSKMSQGLMATMEKAPYYIAGSGTPAPNDLTELYFHLHLMDPGRFNDKKAFMEKYRNLHKGAGMKDKLKQIMNEELDDKVHTVKKEQAKGVKFEQKTHRVELTPEQRDKYRQIQGAFLKGGVMALQRDNALSDVLNNDPNSPKYKEMSSIIDDHLKNKGDSEKVLIYARNYSTVKQIEAFLQQKYPDYGSTRFTGQNRNGGAMTIKQMRENQDKFKKDKNIKFAIHTDAGVEGLNLQHTGKEGESGATTVITMSSGMHSWANVDQFFSRANRKGANKDINAHMILTDTPHDMNTEERLEEKKNVMGLLDNAQPRDELGVIPPQSDKVRGAVQRRARRKAMAKKSMQPQVLIYRRFSL